MLTTKIKLEMSKMIFKGDLITGDFQDKTMTFEIEGEMTLQAGNYTILPTNMYEKLVKGGNISCCPKCKSKNIAHDWAI